MDLQILDNYRIIKIKLSEVGNLLGSTHQLVVEYFVGVFDDNRIIQYFLKY